MNALVPAYKVVQRHFSAPPGKIGLLYGERSVYATGTLVASEVIRRCGAVVFVDGANRVDPYYLARLARYRSLNPAEFLERAFVSRAFTCYQLDVAITDGLVEMLHAVNAASLIVYGPMDLMDDDQAPLCDVYDIWARIRRTLEQLKSENISTLLVSKVPHFQIREREKLFPMLKTMSDVVYRLDSVGGYQRITLEGGTNGTNGGNRNIPDTAGRTKLVKLPEGAQKRGSRFSR
ncbi:MAG: hypothetical protein ACM3Q4_01340 [Acidobacteriota bacterium]